MPCLLRWSFHSLYPTYFLLTGSYLLPWLWNKKICILINLIDEDLYIPWPFSLQKGNCKSSARIWLHIWINKADQLLINISKSIFFVFIILACTVIQSCSALNNPMNPSMHTPTMSNSLSHDARLRITRNVLSRFT